jgi:hypothetical protein
MRAAPARRAAASGCHPEQHACAPWASQWRAAHPSLLRMLVTIYILISPTVITGRMNKAQAARIPFWTKGCIYASFMKTSRFISISQFDF